MQSRRHHSQVSLWCECEAGGWVGAVSKPPSSATVLMSGHSHFIFRPLFSQHQCDSPTGYPVNRRHVSNTCWGTRDWKLTAPLCMRIFGPSSSTNISDKSTQLWVDKYTVCKFQVHYYYLHQSTENMILNWAGQHPPMLFLLPGSQVVQSTFVQVIQPSV